MIILHIRMRMVMKSFENILIAIPDRKSSQLGLLCKSPCSEPRGPHFGLTANYIYYCCVILDDTSSKIKKKILDQFSDYFQLKHLMKHMESSLKLQNIPYLLTHKSIHKNERRKIHLKMETMPTKIIITLLLLYIIKYNDSFKIEGCFSCCFIHKVSRSLFSQTRSRASFYLARMLKQG